MSHTQNGGEMIKLFICPKCGWIREVSRRKSAECFKCGNEDMKPLDLEYDNYIKLDTEERKLISDKWMMEYEKREKYSE